jgi:hypothetical protein
LIKPTARPFSSHRKTVPVNAACQAAAHYKGGLLNYDDYPARATELARVTLVDVIPKR